MKRLGLVLLVLSISMFYLSATTVLSVRANDSQNTSSQIVIKLDEASSYNYSAKGDMIYVTVPNSDLLARTAEYRRLSHVVDYIDVSNEANNSYITIKTMGNYNVDHYKQGSSIVIDVTNPAAKPVTGEHPVVAAAQANPKPAASKTAVTPANTDANAPQIKTDEKAQAAHGQKPDSLATPARKAEPAKKPAVKYDKIPFWDNMAMAIEPNLDLYGLMLFLILSIIAYLVFSNMKFKSSSKPKTKPAKRTADLGLNGATLIMDSDTKVKMVSKLINDGWTSREIAKEMKLSLKDVEMLVSRAQSSDHSVE